MNGMIVPVAKPHHGHEAILWRIQRSSNLARRSLAWKSNLLLDAPDGRRLRKMQSSMLIRFLVLRKADSVNHRLLNRSMQEQHFA